MRDQVYGAFARQIKRKRLSAECICTAAPPQTVIADEARLKGVVKGAGFATFRRQGEARSGARRVLNR
ncbi:MAG: hypothetical protein R3C25_14425 [Hyphomonadaceae bacterium]